MACVMADGRGGWPDLQGEDRVLRERLSATFDFSLLPTLRYIFFSNSYLVAICSSRTINVMWL